MTSRSGYTSLATHSRLRLRHNVPIRSYNCMLNSFFSDKQHTERTDMDWNERDNKSQERSKFIFQPKRRDSHNKCVSIKSLLVKEQDFSSHISADAQTRDEKVHKWSGTLRSSQS